MSTNIKKKILLTGASGSIGEEVMNLLAGREGIELWVYDLLTRRSRKLFRRYSGKIHVISGNLLKANDLQHIPRGIHTLIHLAAVIPPAADRNPQLTRSVNVEGTQQLLNYLKQRSPDAFVLFSSSVAVYGDRLQNPEIRVTDALPATNDIYAETKVEAEGIVRNSGMTYAIFRLTAIMKRHKISPLMFHMPLDTIMEICTAEDAAQAFVSAIDHHDELQGKTFNLGGGIDCCIRFGDFLQRSFQLYGLGKMHFPQHAFAQRNFHCGIMADGDDLEQILHFRRNTLESYFLKTTAEVSPLIKIAGFIFRPLIRLFLTLTSQPLRAFRSHNLKEMKQFF